MVGGRIVQPCGYWPGWWIQAQVVIPPCQARVNPWSRSLVGLPTLLAATAPERVEAFSEKALPCEGIDYGATYSSSEFTCANGEKVGEGARRNFQIGVAWQRWVRGDGTIFGFAPPDEFTWVIPDRPWNGGEKVFFTGPNQILQYTFETSSWGMPEIGPQWNPACQDRDCSYDERVLFPTGMPAYPVRVLTHWWPEWTLRFDEYVCADRQWSDCFCREEGEPIGIPHQSCPNKPASCKGWWGRIEKCSGWKWRNVTNATALGFGCDAPGKVGGWCKYDLRRLGFQPLVQWGGVVVAGADPDGVPRGSFMRFGNGDVIPIPVIEVQPVKSP